MNGCVFKRKLPSGAITWGYSIDAGIGPDGKRNVYSRADSIVRAKPETRCKNC
jgi:hypothetical protein